MKKNTVETLKDSAPSFISSLGSYIKSLISLDNKKELIDSATGSIGFLIQLFGKPIIDNYYDKQSSNRLRISICSYEKLPMNRAWHDAS